MRVQTSGQGLYTLHYFRVSWFEFHTSVPPLRVNISYSRELVGAFLLLLPSSLEGSWLEAAFDDDGAFEDGLKRGGGARACCSASAAKRPMSTYRRANIVVVPHGICTRMIWK